MPDDYIHGEHESMRFERIKADLKVGCDCIRDNAENTDDVFGRRIFGFEPTDDDFLSYLELGKRLSGNNCKAHCQYRGVSMTLVRSRDQKTEHWKTVASFKPIWRYWLLFRLKPTAGVVWATPSTSDIDHHDLLKSDHFSIAFLDLIEVFDAQDNDV